MCKHCVSIFQSYITHIPFWTRWTWKVHAGNSFRLLSQLPSSMLSNFPDPWSESQVEIIAFHSLWIITTVQTFIFHPIQSSGSQLLPDSKKVTQKRENMAHYFVSEFLFFHPPLSHPTPPQLHLVWNKVKDQRRQRRDQRSPLPVSFVVLSWILYAVCCGTPEMLGCHSPLSILQSPPWQILIPSIPNKGDALALTSHNDSQLHHQYIPRVPLLHQEGTIWGDLRPVKFHGVHVAQGKLWICR